MSSAATEYSPAHAMNPAERHILPLVVFLFFAWGFATVLLDTLIPKLKSLFALNYAEVMLTQFSFFLSYFLFSLPAAAILSRIGYLRSIVLGLVVMAAGASLISPAAIVGVYWGFLGALFVMAAGITMLQVAANPFIAVLGSERDAPARLTLAQAFNSLGTTIGPLVGAHFILGTLSSATSASSDTPLAVLRAQEATALQIPFVVIALALVAVATVFWLRRNADVSRAGSATNFRAMRRVLSQPQLAWGAICIFLYVGAEVSIGSLLVNYLMQESVLALAAARAGSLVSLYWGGAMVGRFLGSAILQRMPAGLVLMFCALAAATLAGVSASTVGVVAGFAVLAIGLFNSIMFPTIFSLAIDGLGDDKPTGSGTLCMAIVGGAIVPVLTGIAADALGLALAFFIPVICYLTIAGYGMVIWRRSDSSSETGG
jgi:FHS family L-fucose permease-like MFS transporter